MGRRVGGDSGERAGSFRTIAVLTLIPVAGLLLLLGWNMLNGGAPPEQILRIDTSPVPEGTHVAPARTSSSFSEPRPDIAPPEVAAASATGAATQARTKRSIKPGEGTIALIIDDVGFDGQQLARIEALDPNITFAVLPNGNRATEYAEMLHSRGFDVICHLPMEPLGGAASAGKGAILTSMSDAEIAERTRENVGAIPFARGVNNHMGSKATRDERVMKSVLSSLPRGMFFVDSRTVGGSVAGPLAKQMSIPTVSRDVFLDDVQTEPKIREQLQRAVGIAASGRVAVVIGHPHPETIRVLEAEIPRLKAGGLKLVRVAETVR